MEVLLVLERKSIAEEEMSHLKNEGYARTPVMVKNRLNAGGGMVK